MQARYEWDQAKAAANLVRHGVAFESVERFDWEGALTREDTRFAYGERRWRSLGKIGDRVHLVVYTWRDGAMRIISLRRANRREVREHERG